MKQSDELTAFYQAYRDWVNAGAPIDCQETDDNQYGFSRGSGLCSNLRYYCSNYGCYGVRNTYVSEMQGQFYRAGLHIRYPFNATPHHYQIEMGKDACHLNKERMQWVIDHCEPKEEQS